MEKDDLIRRDAFAEDGRGRWVVITNAGRVMQSRMWAVYAVSLQKHLGDKLGEVRAAQLGDLLTILSRTG